MSLQSFQTPEPRNKDNQYHGTIYNYKLGSVQSDKSQIQQRHHQIAPDQSDQENYKMPSHPHKQQHLAAT